MFHFNEPEMMNEIFIISGFNRNVILTIANLSSTIKTNQLVCFYYE